MGRDACDASAAARAVFEAADDALGMRLSKLCFEGPEDDLVRTENQQPAILTTSIALLRALEERTEVAPAFVAGHSLGEYSALVASGARPHGAYADTCAGKGDVERFLGSAQDSNFNVGVDPAAGALAQLR